jgi:aspartyl-tRNA(Asn)/glutamyl-tRNA(Gln) amidotransferase subunit A
VFLSSAMDIANDASFTIHRFSTLIRRRKISPVELLDFCLDRIERFGPALNAFITVTGESARRQARRAEREIARGAYRGPLHGIPISLKDLFFTRGTRTTAGSRILRKFVPEENAAVVDRLEEAGAVFVGKTNLHEFAFGATSVNPHYGPVRNPWNPARISGGSSGGSAVSVVAAMALGSLGTDTGGSIRIPAAACGCVGLKPTYGRVSLSGVVPLATSLDHVGPLARCVEDAAILFEAIADPVAGGGQKSGVVSRRIKNSLRGLRAGIPKSYFFDRLQPDVRKSVLEAIEGMRKSGLEVREIDLKRTRQTKQLASEITFAEAVVYHRHWLRTRAGDYGSDVRGRLQEGEKQLAVTYLEAQHARLAYAEEFALALESLDILIMPTLPVVAPPVEEADVAIGRVREDVRLALLSLTRPGNLSGLPAISVPCGFSKDGMPIGLQIMGRWWGETEVLRAAWSYEQLTGWHDRFPPDLCR